MLGIKARTERDFGGRTDFFELDLMNTDTEFLPAEGTAINDLAVNVHCSQSPAPENVSQLHKATLAPGSHHAWCQ